MRFLLVFLFFYSCTQTKDKNLTNIFIGPIAKVERTLKMEAKLGEGAFWNHKTNALYWIDIEGKQFHIYTPADNSNTTFDLPSRIGTVVPTSEGNALLALEDGIYSLNLKTKKIELFSAIEKDIPTNRFNDGKCDPAGRLWAGTMRMDETEAAAKLYSIEADGSYKERLDKITISNGIVWTKDAKTMYYIDTPTSNIRAFDYDKASGDISNERIAVRVPNSLGFPDGMAIDENDKLWVAMWNGNAVIQFDPLTGQVLRKLEVPAHNVTSCAFGGENLSTLYITSARVDMSEEELQEFPDAGSIFKIDLNTKGVPSPFFLRN